MAYVLLVADPEIWNGGWQKSKGWDLGRLCFESATVCCKFLLFISVFSQNCCAVMYM